MTIPIVKTNFDSFMAFKLDDSNIGIKSSSLD